MSVNQTLYTKKKKSYRVEHVACVHSCLIELAALARMMDVAFTFGADDLGNTVRVQLFIHLECCVHDIPEGEERQRRGPLGES